MKKSVEAVGAAHLATLQAHMEAMAKRLGAKPVKIELSDAGEEGDEDRPEDDGQGQGRRLQGYRKYLDAVPQDRAGEVSLPGRTVQHRPSSSS